MGPNYMHLKCYKFLYYIKNPLKIKGVSKLSESQKEEVNQVVKTWNEVYLPVYKRKSEKVIDNTKKPKTEEKRLFLMLPNDIIPLIASYGDHYDTIALAKTCKTLYEIITTSDQIWKGICQSIWKKVDFNDIKIPFYKRFIKLTQHSCIECFGNSTDADYNLYYQGYICKKCKYKLRFAIVCESYLIDTDFYQNKFPQKTIKEYQSYGEYKKFFLKDIIDYCQQNQIEIDTKNFKNLD